MDELTASARKAEAERLRQVLKCSEAKHLPHLAEHLAFETDETAKSCLKILKIAVADSQATPARP
ncbi:hypothetical protein ACC705_32965 [Rhizobium ruizarguesonis]